MTYRKRWLSPMLTVVGMICVCMVAIFGTGSSAYAASNDPIPGGNVADPVVRSVDIAKPAVVRIITVATGHLAVNFSPNNTVLFPQGTGKAYDMQFSGTGTLITAKGDILTADHVVNPLAALYEFAAPDIVTYINQHPGVVAQGQLSEGEVFNALLTNQLPSTPTITGTHSIAFLSTDYTGPLSVSKINDVPVQLQGEITQIEKESATSQRDVAIVHANFSINDLPLVQLGDSSAVQQQDELTIIGFPGNGDVSDTATNLLTSSVNKINVSSIKTTDNQAPVIQVGGNVEQGDSGGPALDSKGTVVGVVSFGATQTAGSTSFLQASNSARDLLQGLNLDTKPGSFQTQWAQAFNDYASSEPGHWHKAEQEFQQLATNYPEFKAITSYLTYAKTQASTEKVGATPTPQAKSQSPAAAPAGGSLQALILTVGSLLAVAVLIALLFGVIARQRKKAGAAKGAASGVSAQATSPTRGSASASVGQAQPTQASTVSTVQQSPRKPGQSGPGAQDDDGMTAFGAPPKRSSNVQTPVPSSTSLPTTPQGTISLRVWPCGHMNRSNARFCTVCGEPAPEPPTIIRRVEQ